MRKTGPTLAVVVVLIVLFQLYHIMHTMHSTDRITEATLQEPRWISKLHSLLDERIKKAKESSTTGNNQDAELRNDLTEVTNSVANTVEDMVTVKQTLEDVTADEKADKEEIARLKAQIASLQEKLTEKDTTQNELAKELKEAMSQFKQEKEKMEAITLKSRSGMQIQERTDRGSASDRMKQILKTREDKEIESALTNMKGEKFADTVDPKQLDDPVAENGRRLDIVKDSFLHAWNGYKKHAWGHDEMFATSGRPKDWAGRGFGISIIEGMTTAWIMGLTEEFEKGVEWIEHSLNLDLTGDVSVFECVIRVLGGLLSCYELSGGQYPAILRKATDLGNRLINAFNTPTGYPRPSINVKTVKPGATFSGGTSVLAELGTMQLEFRTLSYLTGNSTYDKLATIAVKRVREKLKADASGGRPHLPYVTLSATTGGWSGDHVTMGGRADSFYEYLLKAYLLGGQQEQYWLDYFTDMADIITSKLIRRSTPGNYCYFVETKGGTAKHEMDHLACFAGGMFAHAADAVKNVDAARRKKWMEIGECISETCHYMYASTRTGLGPEIEKFIDGHDGAPKVKKYLLRPEAVESWFYMWRATHDQKWRDYGWQMMRALNTWARTDKGYSGLQNVNAAPPGRDDLQQSFFLAETLKYLYLLFADDDTFDLSEWVFNTEAHPLKVELGKTATPVDVPPIRAPPPRPQQIGRKTELGKKPAVQQERERNEAERILQIRRDSAALKRSGAAKRK